MRTLITGIITISLLLFPGCKKTDKGEETAIAKKYAKYPVAVKKDKNLDKWLATLAKAEDVSLLEELKHKTPKGKELELSKIKLADDSVGYVESRHLADSPIVFIEETDVYVRPTAGSRPYATIPPGTLGFITSEKGAWVQVFIGKVNGKNIYSQWVEKGYSADRDLILDAREYETAIEKLESGNETKISEAKETLNELKNKSNVIGRLAEEKLGDSGETYGETTVEESAEEVMPDDEPSGDEPTSGME